MNIYVTRLRPDFFELLVDFYNILYSIFFRLWYLKKIKNKFSKNSNSPKRWFSINGRLLESNTDFFSFLMATAPRWNVHALIIASPVFKSEKSIRIDFQKFRNSAELWNISLYELKTNRPVKDFRSVDPMLGDSIEFNVKKSSYRFVIRMYGWKPEILSPEICIDQKNIMQPQRIDHDGNRFYKSMQTDNGGFYRRLNLFSVLLVKYERFIGEQYVRKKFLPAADPGTEFKYGYLNKTEELRVELSAGDCKRRRFYFCFYNESSMPVDWCELDELRFTYINMEYSGCFVIRILSR